MKQLFSLLALVVVLLSSSSPLTAQTATGSTATSTPSQPSAPSDELRALIKKVETQHRGLTSHGKTRMVIVTKDWSRTLTMETWSEGRDRFLVQILDPAKERGTSTLKVQNEIWNFFPKIDRLIKIPSSLMGDKWMGSHFTNDDLVKEDKIDELYDLTELRRDGKTIVILATPKPTAAVVWGKLEYSIDREKEVPQFIDYYDEAGKKVRTMIFDRVELVCNRWVARRMKVQPLPTTAEAQPSGGPAESTEMNFDELEFDVKLPGNLFSLQSLRKR